MDERVTSKRRKNQVVHKNQFGTVIPYTRHTARCPNGRDNSCSCPKWLYVNQRGTKPFRFSATTPSFAEATRMAADKLREFDPEIAASRAAKIAVEQQQVTVEAACKLWTDRAINRRPSGMNTGGTLQQYTILMGHVKHWAEDNGIRYINEITTDNLTAWRNSDDWKRLAPTTQHQRWGVLRSFFGYLVTLKKISDNPIESLPVIELSKDHRQGPYTTEQINAILASVSKTVPTVGPTAQREIYAQRLTCFLQLLLNTGCDVIDAVLFEPSRITKKALDGEWVWAYRYNRQRTGVRASIPLDPDIAALLRNVPCAENKPQMPFRSIGTSIRSDVSTWTGRISRCMKAAGVHTVELPSLDLDGNPITKAANAKQFRHTFALRQLSAGQRPEEVAIMLGHTNTDMVYKFYVTWGDELDNAHLRMVMKVRSSG